MKQQNALVFGAAGLWIIAKVAAFWSGNSYAFFNYAVMLQMLLLITAMFGGLYIHYRSGNAYQSNFLSDIKIALQAGGKYLLLTIGAMAVYYAYLDKEFFANRTQQVVNLAEEQIADAEQWKQIKSTDPQLRDISKEEYLQKVTENAQLLNSTQVFLALATLFSILMAVVYSVIIVLMFRFLLFKTYHENNTPPEVSLN